MPQGDGGRFGGDALDPARTMGIERVPWVSRQNGTALAVSTGYTPPVGPVHPAPCGNRSRPTGKRYGMGIRRRSLPHGAGRFVLCAWITMMVT
jgi:hypothetical protein